MAYEQKNNSGSLFKNERKEEEKHPDYNGSFNIDGQEYWLNAWLKKSKDGKPYMSLSVKPKEARAQRGGGNQGGGGYAQRDDRGGGQQQRGAGQKYGDWRDKGGGGGTPDDIPFAPCR